MLGRVNGPVTVSHVRILLLSSLIRGCSFISVVPCGGAGGMQQLRAFGNGQCIKIIVHVKPVH